MVWRLFLGQRRNQPKISGSAKLYSSRNSLAALPPELPRYNIFGYLIDGVARSLNIGGIINNEGHQKSLAYLSHLAMVLYFLMFIAIPYT